MVRGSSLTRFLKWAGKSQTLIEGRTDGPFLVRGKLWLSETELALTEAVAELQGVPLSGDVRHELKNRRRVAVRLDGQSIDLAHVWPGALDWIAAVVPFVAPQAKPGTAAKPSDDAAKPATSVTAAPAAADDAAGTDLTLRVRVAELIAGTRTLRDVDADLAVDRGKLSIPRLRLSTSDGLEVDLEGEILDATTKPKGVLRGHVSADRPAAVEALFRALGEAIGRRCAARAHRRAGAAAVGGAGVAGAAWRGGGRHRR